MKRTVKITMITTTLILGLNMIPKPEYNTYQADTSVVDNIIKNIKAKAEQQRLAKLKEQQVVEEIKMPKYEISLSNDLQRYTWNLCQKYELSYEMVLALMYIESKFDIKAINHNSDGSKDQGISQLNDRYSKVFASRAGINNFNPYNPEHNIKTCIVRLRDIKDYWINQGINDEESLLYYTVNSYNMGITNYSKYVKKYKKLSRPYDRKILEIKNKLESEGKI